MDERKNVYQKKRDTKRKTRGKVTGLYRVGSQKTRCARVETEKNGHCMTTAVCKKSSFHCCLLFLSASC